jgi:hypothetical protein
MKIEQYSHCGGAQVVNPKSYLDIIHILEALDFEIYNGCSDRLRNAILSGLKLSLGWSNEFILDTDSRISLTSSLDGHVLCLQTGNMSRFYADLLKMQYVYVNGTAKAAFYILPSKDAAKSMGDNIAHFVRFKKELQLFQSIITIPTVVLGIN